MSYDNVPRTLGAHDDKGTYEWRSGERRYVCKTYALGFDEGFWAVEVYEGAAEIPLVLDGGWVENSLAALTAAIASSYVHEHCYGEPQMAVLPFWYLAVQGLSEPA